MFWTKIKIAAVVMLAFTLAGTGAGVLAHHTLTAEQPGLVQPSDDQPAAPLAGVNPPLPPIDGADEKPDPNKKPEGEKPDPNAKREGEKPDPNAKREGEKPDPNAKPAGEKPSAKGTVFGNLDPAKYTITISVKLNNNLFQDQTFTLAKDVKVSVLGKEGGTLKDVAAGMKVMLILSPDRKSVIEIKQERPD
jgi:hypothetical protein